MLYNLRADVIYYKSSSDFELEFNLCGCCRMRLLTDKPSNKKTFVHSLARAVSRSRVIIIAGPIFGEENTIEIVSQALGTTTEIADNKTYNIASDDEIEIIKGSIPLVSNDGSFGGCIIESGPQTMILLTDNKTLRKTIMSSLIHPYITELYDSENAAENNSLETIEAKALTSIENDLIIDQIDEDISVNKSEDITAEDLLPEQNNTNISEGDEENVPQSSTLIIENTEEATVISEDTEVVEEHTPDIDINTLIQHESEHHTPTRPIEEHIDESQIIFETEDEGEHNFPEEYHQAFDKLFMEEDHNSTDESYLKKPQLYNGYQFLDDDGEVMENTEGVVEGRVSHIDVLTIVISVILFLALIVICYCIFSVTVKNGISPSEYIQNIWNTLFG